MRLALLRHQVRYDQIKFWRDPQAVFFTIALPVVFLVIFAAIFGNQTVDDRQGLKVSTYYVPGIIALGVMAAAFVSLSITVVEERERGIIKRLRATPLPPAAFILARASTAVVLSLLVAVVLTLVGRVLYGVTVPDSSVPGIVLTLLVGTACFCCLGFALSGVVRSANAAQAVANMIVLPLQMISGIFFPTDLLPASVLQVAKLFPVYWLAEGLLDGFDPNGPASGVDPTALAVLAAWGVAGLLVARRTFRWEPRGR
jgi:ABC-2 type transport system permease protein